MWVRDDDSVMTYVRYIVTESVAEGRDVNVSDD